MQSKKPLFFNWLTLTTSFCMAFLVGCLVLSYLYQNFAQNFGWGTTKDNFQLYQTSAAIGATELTQLSSSDFKTAIFPLQKIISDNGVAVTKYLSGKGISKDYGIYFTEISDPTNLYTHNPNCDFVPASMYKVPLTIVVLHLVEAGEIKLSDIIPVQIYGTSNYQYISVDQTIKKMIRESNNEAMTALEKKSGGYTRVQGFLSGLGLKVIRRGQHTTPQDLGNAFKILVDNNNHFINDTNKQYLLEQMFNVVEAQRDRIPAGAKEYLAESPDPVVRAKTVKVANKIGNLDAVYQDGAIIFSEGRTFILIILDLHQDTGKARTNIRTITKLLLNNLI